MSRHYLVIAAVLTLLGVVSVPATAFAQLEVRHLFGPTFHPLPDSWRLVLAKTVAIEQESTEEHDEQVSRQVVLKDFFGGEEHLEKTFTGKSYTRRKWNSSGAVVNPPLKVGEVNLWRFYPSSPQGAIILRQNAEEESWKDWMELTDLCLAVANADEKDWVSLIKPKVASDNEVMAIGAVNMLYRWASPEAQQALRDLAEEGAVSIGAMRKIDESLLSLGRRTYKTKPSSEWLESKARLKMVKQIVPRIETREDGWNVVGALREPGIYDGPYAKEYLAILVELTTTPKHLPDVRISAAETLGSAAWTSESPIVRQAMLDLLVSNQPANVRSALVKEIDSHARRLGLEEHRGLIESLRAEEKSPEHKKLLGQLLLSIDEAAEIDE